MAAAIKNGLANQANKQTPPLPTGLFIAYNLPGIHVIARKSAADRCIPGKNSTFPACI
jgi:hypothetical protein